MEGDSGGWTKMADQVPKTDIIGSGLAMPTRHPIQIFFIGIGSDADMEVGRMLAQATGAEFQGVADKDLAQLTGGIQQILLKPGQLSHMGDGASSTSAPSPP